MSRDSLTSRVAEMLRGRPALPSLSEREAADRLRPHGSIDVISPVQSPFLTRHAPLLATAGGARGEPEEFDGAGNSTDRPG